MDIKTYIDLITDQGPAFGYHINMGPAFGYHINMKKTWLLVKEQHLPSVIDLFRDCNINITSSVCNYLGATIRHSASCEDLLHDKVPTWGNSVTALAEIAQSQPHAAYSASLQGLCHQWSFISRTFPNVSPLFIPLEKAIRHHLIPALFGRKVSDSERALLALPPRLGGLGIVNPVMDPEIE